MKINTEKMLAWTGILVTAGFFVWVMIFTGNESVLSLGANIGSAIAVWLVAGWLWLIWRQNRVGSGVGHRRYLLAFLVGIIAFAIAETYWLIVDNGLGLEVPYPSVADIFYLLQIIAFMWGMLWILSAHKGNLRMLRLMFDILIVMTVAATFSWYFLIEPMLRTTSRLQFGDIVNLLYPLGDLGLLFCLLSLSFLLKGQVPPRFLLLLGVGIFVQIAADTFYWYAVYVNEYDTGSWMDPLWPLALWLFTAGVSFVGKEGFQFNGAGNKPSEALDYGRIILTYGSLVILFIMLVLQTDRLNVFTIGACITVLLMVIRQIVTLMENDRLIKSIRSWNEKLELTVNVRTNELQDKNTELQQALGNLEYLANHDALTSLPNRRLFADRLNQAITLAKREQYQLAVLFIDLDRFKAVNDYMGHSYGDALLLQAADRFRSSLRGVDTVARQGGDEFVVLLQSLNKQSNVISVVEKLKKEFNKPFLLASHEVYTTLSIGSAIFPDHGKTAEEIMRSADLAMYRVKQSGRNGHLFYNPDMNEDMQLKVELERDLRKSLERDDELELFYQPQYHLTSGKVMAVEALVRWRHPQLGLLGPVKFIPIAEESGLILPLSRWVLRTACRQLQQWQSQEAANLRVAVNVSPLQFLQESFVTEVMDILQETGLDPKLLELEITEGMAMREVEKVITKLKVLREQGIQLSIDDFGTGYSSLSYLRKFPINTLKIDKSFIDEMLKSNDDSNLVQAIIDMGHNMSFKVIAEGVETEQQFDYLRSLGCDEIQGYFISRPLPFDQLKSMLTGFQTKQTF